MADPEYQAQQEAKRIERNKKNMERYYKNHIPIAELEELAKTDPEAAETLRIRRETQAEKNRQNKQRREERMAQDPEYAAKIWLDVPSQPESIPQSVAEYDELKEEPRRYGPPQKSKLNAQTRKHPETLRKAGPYGS